MSSEDTLFGNVPQDVVCGDCSYPMAHVRTAGDAYGALFQFECSKCSARGTVEVRDEQSAAANAPLTEYHGAVENTGGGNDE